MKPRERDHRIFFLLRYAAALRFLLKQPDAGDVRATLRSVSAQAKLCLTEPDTTRGRTVLKASKMGGDNRAKPFQEHKPKILGCALAYWNKRPEASNREVSKFLSGKGFGPAETIRKRIAGKKPRRKTG